MDDGPCSNLVYPLNNITQYVLFTLGERCLPYSIVLPTVIFYVLIFLAGVFGNVCTCVVIAKCLAMHNTTNYYLFSLAVSDLLILLIGLPMELHDVLSSTYPYKFGSVICKLRAFLVEFTSYASILIISAFTTERWLAICFPLQIRHFSSMSRAFKVIPIAWFIAFTAALPMAFVVKVNRLALPLSAINSSWAHLVSNDGQTIRDTEFCAMDVNNPEAQKFLIYFAFTVFFLLPAVLITVAYFFIGIKLHQADASLKNDEQSYMGKSTTQKNSIIKVLASVVIVFFLSWLPFHMQRLLSIYLLEAEANNGDALHIIFTSVFYISGCCYYSNSACNPILYSIFSRNYRQAFLQTFTGRKRSTHAFSSAETGMRRSNLSPKQNFYRGITSGIVESRTLCDTRESSLRRTYL